MTDSKSDDADRRSWLAVLARMGRDELADAWAGLADTPEMVSVRPAQAGMVMAEGRAGGTGQRFNVGHVSVSRATVRLSTGELGVGYCLGHDEGKAEYVARFDALLQTGARNELMRDLIAPAAVRQAELRARRARKAASSKVEFFTVVRGENADRNLRS